MSDVRTEWFINITNREIVLACILFGIIWSFETDFFLSIDLCIQGAPTCGTHVAAADSSDGESCSDSDSEHNDSSDDDDEGKTSISIFFYNPCF